MKDIRMEPVENGQAVLIDVVCDCGANGLQNEATKEISFKHRVVLGAGKPSVVLHCLCNKRYELRPQGTHVHAFSLRA